MKLNKESMLVYAITDRHWTGMQTLEQQVDDVLKNGATFLQIREKNMPHDELVKEAVHIKEIAAKYNVPVVIDDDIYAVMESGVDGVHIGQNDMDYVEARKLLGDNKIIGMTAPSVSLAKKADVVLIAPASANVIGKLANGIADDMLTTTVMACKCKKIISPAMNTNMYENPIVQDNIAKLKRFGMQVIEPDVGLLACKDVGAGKMPSEDTLLDFILQEILFEKDLAGKKVLVTAGPTMEAIDPVRFISNHSTGKMGYAVAKTAARRGAKVTLVSGPVNLLPPRFVETVQIESAAQMYEEVIKRADAQDIIIKAAAVADYTPENTADEKIKKKVHNLK